MNSATPTFRIATDSDAESMASIHRMARLRAMPWLPDLHTPEEDVAFFRENVTPNCVTRIAEIDARPVGFCSMQGDWIEHLYVHPSVWRERLGSDLLYWAQSNAQSLQLWTFQRNAPARAFYERHGFVVAELSDGSRNEETEPDMRYVWQRRDAP